MSDLEPLPVEGMAAGHIGPYDPELLSQALIGLIQHMAGSWAENPQRYSRAAVEEFLRAFITSGINVGGPGAPGPARG